MSFHTILILLIVLSANQLQASHSDRCRVATKKVGTESISEETPPKKLKPTAKEAKKNVSTEDAHPEAKRLLRLRYSARYPASGNYYHPRSEAAKKLFQDGLSDGKTFNEADMKIIFGSLYDGSHFSVEFVNSPTAQQLGFKKSAMLALRANEGDDRSSANVVRLLAYNMEKPSKKEVEEVGQLLSSEGKKQLDEVFADIERVNNEKPTPDVNKIISKKYSSKSERDLTLSNYAYRNQKRLIAPADWVALAEGVSAKSREDIADAFINSQAIETGNYTPYEIKFIMNGILKGCKPSKKLDELYVNLAIRRIEAHDKHGWINASEHSSSLRGFDDTPYSMTIFKVTNDHELDWIGNHVTTEQGKNIWWEKIVNERLN